MWIKLFFFQSFFGLGSGGLQIKITVNGTPETHPNNIVYLRHRPSWKVRKNVFTVLKNHPNNNNIALGGSSFFRRPTNPGTIAYSLFLERDWIVRVRYCRQIFHNSLFVLLIVKGGERERERSGDFDMRRRHWQRCARDCVSLIFDWKLTEVY